MNCARATTLVALREALSTEPRLIVIGAGFIGQEVAATAKRLGAPVTIIDAAATPLEAILGRQLGEWFADFHRREGIKLGLSARIARFHGARAVQWEAAARQGAGAARAMLGLPTPAAPPRSFWSDQHGVRIQFVGDTHRADRLQIDGQPAASDFTALFTHNDRPVAALLVGRRRALPELRQRIRDAARTNNHERNAA